MSDYGNSGGGRNYGWVEGAWWGVLGEVRQTIVRQGVEGEEEGIMGGSRMWRLGKVVRGVGTAVRLGRC